MNEPYYLSKGAHNSPAEGRCFMEYAAWLAGEDHSDQPACVSPVLRAFGVGLNDALPDEERQKLRPLVARALGTNGDGLDERRAWMCTDWLVRVYAPAWMDLVPALKPDADRLRNLPLVVSADAARAAMDDLNASQSHAAAAQAAARSATRAAAWDATWAVRRAAAGNAARVSVVSATRSAAQAATRTAAWAVEGDALQPTVKMLQASAIGLLESMLPMSIVQIPVVSEAEWRALVQA